jgi:4-hydroxybenzoate polyprenyltransferase
MKAYWIILRPVNLLLTLLTQGLFYLSASRVYTNNLIIDWENIRYPAALYNTLACILIASGGYIINDIFDIETDTINKPHKRIIAKSIKLKHARIYYAILTTIGIGFGFLTGFGMGILCVTMSVLLYFYSSDFKGEHLQGNLLISLMAGMVVYVASRGVYGVSKTFFAEYACIAFLITLSREMIKDIEDMEGDSIQGYNTYPILKGIKKTKRLASISFFLALLLLPIIYFQSYEILFLAFSTLIILPFAAFITIKIYKAKNTEDYSSISKYLKQIMFAGLISCLVC